MREAPPSLLEATLEHKVDTKERSVVLLYLSHSSVVLLYLSHSAVLCFYTYHIAVLCFYTYHIAVLCFYTYHIAPCHKALSSPWPLPAFACDAVGWHLSMVCIQLFGPG